MTKRERALLAAALDYLTNRVEFRIVNAVETALSVLAPDPKVRSRFTERVNFQKGVKVPERALYNFVMLKGKGKEYVTLEEAQKEFRKEVKKHRLRPRNTPFGYD